MKSRTVGVTGLAVAAMALTACGSATPSHPVTSRPAATQAAAAAPATTPSQTCAQQDAAWWNDQGKAQEHQVSSDLGALAKDGQAAASAMGSGANLTAPLAKEQAGATALETDAQSAAANPPPACADAGDYGTAMQDYETGAKDELAAINDMSNGDYTSADALLRAGAKAMDNGNSALGRATAALQQS